MHNSKKEESLIAALEPDKRQVMFSNVIHIGDGGSLGKQTQCDHIAPGTQGKHCTVPSGEFK